MAATKDDTLEAQLTRRGFESIALARPAAGEVRVEANKLYPLPVPGKEPIYAPIPVSASVKLDKGGRIESIAGDKPSDRSVAEAVHFFNGLRERGEVVDEDAPKAEASPRPTHRIVRDEQGRRVLRRQRMSMA
jgi:hypothetical protein